MVTRSVLSRSGVGSLLISASDAGEAVLKTCRVPVLAGRTVEVGNRAADGEQAGVGEGDACGVVRFAG